MDIHFFNWQNSKQFFETFIVLPDDWIDRLQFQFGLARISCWQSATPKGSVVSNILWLTDFKLFTRQLSFRGCAALLKSNFWEVVYRVYLQAWMWSLVWRHLQEPSNYRWESWHEVWEEKSFSRPKFVSKYNSFTKRWSQKVLTVTAMSTVV